MAATVESRIELILEDLVRRSKHVKSEEAFQAIFQKLGTKEGFEVVFQDVKERSTMGDLRPINISGDKRISFMWSQAHRHWFSTGSGLTTRFHLSEATEFFNREDFLFCLWTLSLYNDMDKVDNGKICSWKELYESILGTPVPVGLKIKDAAHEIKTYRDLFNIIGCSVESKRIKLEDGVWVSGYPNSHVVLEYDKVKKEITFHHR